MTALFLVLWMLTLIAFLATRTRLVDERRFSDKLLRQTERQKFGSHPARWTEQQKRYGR